MVPLIIKCEWIDINLIDSNLIGIAVNDYWMSHSYFAVIDAIINDMKTRFSMESLKMAKSIDTFLDLQYVKDSYFVNHYKVSN